MAHHPAGKQENAKLSWQSWQWREGNGVTRLPMLFFRRLGQTAHVPEDREMGA